MLDCDWSSDVCSSDLLDVYFAADPCYAEKAIELRHPLYRLLPRYRHFAAFERSVFDPQSSTQILVLTEQQSAVFAKHYGTPAARFHVLSPGISPDRRAPADAAARRASFRTEQGLTEADYLLLLVGSGFRTKGLDRALAALAALPEQLREHTRLIAIGADNPRPFIRLAHALGIQDRVAILPGRDDIPRFLLGADLLIHPAYSENAGNILLEALVAGLPVLTTDVCGYAHYVVDANAGRVVASPYAQTALDTLLRSMLEDAAAREQWRANALRFAAIADLYSRPEQAADIILAEHP
jgi:UDP-glucose:(heptosyl)LPS alpha-1,3-glucosyltransferase